MTLYDVFMATAYNQIFHVYVTNIYDQNIVIGHGTRQTLLNEEETEEGIDHLLDKVDTLRVAKDGSIVLRLIDENFYKPAEELYLEDFVSSWDNLDPSTRPWKHSCELEDFK